MCLVIGAGTIINPILKIATVVAILAAVSIFIVKPILDTTEREVERASEQSQAALQQGEAQSEEFDLNFARQHALGYAQSLRAGTQPWSEAAREVTRCVREAGGSATQMERCDDFGEIVVTETLSDRNFATSYADSLDAQGDTAAAKQVRDCVDRAGYKPAPMQRCYDLADKLLFG